MKWPTTDSIKKENLLLIIPRYLIYGNQGKYVMPVGILYVSAYVKQSGVANVITLNLNHIEGEERDVISRYIENYKITFAGIGGLSGEYRDLRRITELIKDSSPDVKIVLGGGIVTADPFTTMEAFPEVDFGIIGEGEITMTELLMASVTTGNFNEVDGLIFRKESTLYKTRHRVEIKDLDSLPLPDYEGFDYGDYLRENPDLSDMGKRYSQVSVIGGRSCKYNCTFCFHPSGTTYRQRSLDSIFHEIDFLVEKYDISYIALREELFATDNQRVREFCQRVEQYDFDWSIQLRIDSVNQELVNMLKGTRCRYIFLGIESASDSVLRSMRKGITLKQIEAACEMLQDAGLTFRSGVIMGDAAETRETAYETIEWYKRNSSRYRLYIDMIIAFPGSVLYKNACKNGIIPDKVRFLQDGCPIVNLTTMTSNEFCQLVSDVETINHRCYNVKDYAIQS